MVLGLVLMVVVEVVAVVVVLMLVLMLMLVLVPKQHRVQRAGYGRYALCYVTTLVYHAGSSSLEGLAERAA